jgi:hypothetical protein
VSPSWEACLGAALWLTAAAGLPAAALPPAAEALRAPLQAAERRLQDCTLELQAAKRAVEPLTAEVAQDRQSAGAWWGRWLLKRSLGRLKQGLDKVEAARAAQVEARQRLALLLTAMDEELSGALEASLGGLAGRRPDAEGKAKLQGWWRQKRAWQRRLEALDPASGADIEADAPPAGRLIRLEARQAQVERELGLLGALAGAGALPAGEAQRERGRLTALLAGLRAVKP